MQRPAGHHKYHHDRLHGTLFLTLKVQTSLHISTGVVVMGSDIGNNRVPLIKTMVQGVDNKLSIQGSSLKGCIRSIYEAITNSTLAVITSKYKEQIPRERLPCKNKEELCPASLVFGALDWQGLIDFSDAKCESAGYSTGFMPSLYAPRPQSSGYYTGKNVAGRKFYYHTIRAIDKGQNQGITVQQAAKEFNFKTQLQYRNLTQAELGTLLIVLGQDPKYPIALKVGGGKPIGMGTMTVTVKEIEQGQDLRDRYSSYQLQANRLTGNQLQQLMQTAIKAAHSQLIQSPQLQELAAVLKYPTDREPPEGMYQMELTEIQWKIADAIAQTLVKEDTDVNELGKAIAYLRAYSNRENAGIKFFDYLKTLSRNGKQIGHSKRTSEYYETIAETCSKYLNAYQDNAEIMLQVLGWASRLMRYYKNSGTIGEITAPVVESARQAEIAEMISTQNFAINQIIEATVTAVKGNKVTYEILGTIKLTEKEPKKAQSFSEGQKVKVEILDLKEDGSIKKVKCVN